MKEILIFGSGLHSKVILSEIIQIKGYRVIGFVDENIKKETIIEHPPAKSIEFDIENFRQVNGKDKQVLSHWLNYLKLNQLLF